MKAIFDFLISALPWIAIGLFVACSCVTVKAKRDGKEISRFFEGISWAPAACFLFVAILEMLDGNRSSGTTWLVLGAFNAVINFSNMQKEDATDKRISNKWMKCGIIDSADKSYR